MATIESSESAATGDADGLGRDAPVRAFLFTEVDRERKRRPDREERTEYCDNISE